MFCKKCGNQLDDNSLFCSKCGEKCSTDIDSKSQSEITKPKLSIGEKILRLICVGAIAITVFVGLVQFLVSNITGGILVLLSVVLLIAFVFRKKQMEKIKNKFTSETTRKIAVTIIYLLLPIVMFTSIGIAALVTDDNVGGSANHDAIAISYAESKLKSNLKNPESLQVHSAKIHVDFEWGDYHYYSIIIDYSAQNGLGGYNRDNDYDVIVKVHKETGKASTPTTEEYLDAITNYNNSK